MKKVLLFIFAFNLCYGQIATFTLSEPIPESVSMTIYGVMNPEFNNSFVYRMAHGATVFNQKDELMLIDSKTFEEKKKIKFPNPKGFEAFQSATLKGSIVPFFTKKMTRKFVYYLDVFAYKMDETFTIPPSPEYLFCIKDTEKDRNSMKISVNDEKDLLLFTNESEDQTKNSKTFFYRLFDNKLKLLKFDSIVSDFKSTDTIEAIVYDNGCYFTKKTEKKREILFTDVKNNRSSKLELLDNSKSYVLSQIKTLANGKIIICGNYYEYPAKNKVTNGIFKFTFNTETQKIEEEIYFEHIPAGKNEEGVKEIYQTVITELGACYSIIHQYTIESLYSGGQYAGERKKFTKYEIMYLASNNDKWKKQIPNRYGPIAQYTNDNLYLFYNDYEGKNSSIDYNNYTFGSPYPSSPVTTNQAMGSDLSLLKITSRGEITHQKIEDVTYVDRTQIDNGIVFLTRRVNGMTYTKAKFLKITFIK